MQFTTSLLATMASMTALANAHGYFSSPVGRQPGALFTSECGMQAYYQMSELYRSTGAIEYAFDFC